MLELHPFVLHFAVGLLLAAPLCDAAGLLLRREALLQAGRWNTLLGSIAVAFAVVTGLGAEASLPNHGAAGEALLQLHRALSFLAGALWLGVGAWRFASKRGLPVRLRTLYLAASFTAAAALAADTGLGIVLVYRHGVGLSEAARAEPVRRASPPPTISAPGPGTGR